MTDKPIFYTCSECGLTCTGYLDNHEYIETETALKYLHILYSSLDSRIGKGCPVLPESIVEAIVGEMLDI